MSVPKEEKKPLTLADKYKLKGAQQVTLAEYNAAQARQNKKRKIQVPAFVSFILSTPFLIIFCGGVVFIPYILYKVATSPSAPPPTDDSPAISDVLKKPTINEH